MSNLSHAQKDILAALQNGGTLRRQVGAWRIYDGWDWRVAGADTCERLVQRGYIRSAEPQGMFVLTEKGKQA